MTASRASHQQTPSGPLYQIRVGQHLDPQCSAWLGGLAITNLNGGEAVLSGPLVDQASLYGVLQSLRDLNVPLLGITRESSVSEYDK